MQPAETDARDDWGILVLLICQTDQRPWSVPELTRHQGDQQSVEDSLGRLQRSGLVHRTPDDLVFPTRAALYFEEIRG